MRRWCVEAETEAERGILSDYAISFYAETPLSVVYL